MGLFSRIVGTEQTALAPVQVQRATVGGVSLNELGPLLGSTPSATGLFVSQQTAMSVTSVLAAVTIIAGDVARCTPYLYRKTGKLNERQAVTDHWALDLFERPNDIQTWYEWMEQTVIALELRGNGYSVKIRNRDQSIAKMIPVNPDAVMMLEAPGGFLFYNINRLGLYQMDALTGFPTSIPAEDVLHLRDWTFNMLISPSKIGLLKDAIGLAMGFEQQAARWMGNGARPSGVLQSDKSLTEEAAKRLKAQWENFISGVQNTGRTAVLEEGLKWQQIALDANAVQFIPQRNFSVEEVSRAWRVPLHKLGREITGRLTPAELEQMYVNNTVMPKLVRIEQKLRRELGLDKEGIFIGLDESQLLRGDIGARRNASRTGVISGIITQNEARIDEGRSPLPGGDVLFVPSNTAPQGSDVTGTPGDGAGKPAGNNSPSAPMDGVQPGPDD